MKKKRLLFIAPTSNLAGGADLSLLEFVIAARKRGYYCHVIVPQKGSFSRELKKNNIRHSVFEYSFWHPVFTPKIFGFRNMQAVQKITSIIIKDAIDLVITNTLQIPWAALAATSTNKPHLWLAREPAEFGSAYLKDHFDFIRTYSNSIMANSRELARYLKASGYVPKAGVFYSFVDSSQISLNPAIKNPRIVCVGNINSNKNQLLLVMALGILKQRGKLNLKAIFIGDFYEKDEHYIKIKSSIRKFKLQNDIEFLGFQKNPYKYIGENDIVVQTSAAESMGRVTVEIMKLGLICLGADIPATRECFELGGGQLFELNRPDKLADLIQEVQDNHKEYKSKALVAQKRALKNLSEKRCHLPLFAAIDNLKATGNPRHELRHILPYTYGGLHELELKDEVINGKLKEIELLKKHIAFQDSELSAIKNSKTWRYSRKLNRIIGR